MSMPGGLAHVLHRAARAAAPAYTELCEQVRNAPVVTPDETGWRVGGVRHWLWTFVTPDTTVYAICPGRGFNDAATVLGTDYAGVLVRDGWAPYRCYHGLHQTCLNHLLQRCKQLREDHTSYLRAFAERQERSYAAVRQRASRLGIRNTLEPKPAHPIVTGGTGGNALGGFLPGRKELKAFV